MPLTHIYFSDNSLSIFHCDIYDFPLNSIAVFIASKPFMFYDKFYVLYSHAFTNTHTHIYILFNLNAFWLLMNWNSLGN